MKRAFTLIELLVVISIMALMGTVAVGGYRAMRRGMEERGTMENVNAFIRTAYQRAQVDRQPTAVFFWNETLTTEDGSNNTLRVVGKAVAVRRHGRITKVEGNHLHDEFADLNQTYDVADDGSETASGGSGTMFLYPMDNMSDVASSGDIYRSTVGSMVVETELRLSYLSSSDGELPKQAECDDDIQGQTASGESPTELKTYAFQIVDAGDVTWERGMAYGFEFAQIQLPVGYIFGASYSSSTDAPIRKAGSLVFLPGANSGSGTSAPGTILGRSTIAVYTMRPNENGEISAQSVGTSADPSKDLN